MKSHVLLPAIVSGVLLWTAFFPLDLGPIAFVAIAPFLTLVRAENTTAKRRYGAAFLGGFVFSLLALQWLRAAHPMMERFAWPGLSIFLALFWPLALLLMRKLDRLKLPLAVTFPVVWVSLEYLRTHFPTGFPFLSYVHAHQLAGFSWYCLGIAMHNILPMIQAADLGGVHLISVAVASVNGAVYECLVRSQSVRALLKWPPLPNPKGCVRESKILAASLVLPMALICYGALRLSHPPFEVGPRIAAIQGNISQNEKMIRGEQLEENEEPPLIREYFPLAERAARADAEGPKPDLIIWPETCFPYDWLQIQGSSQESIREDARAYAQRAPKMMGDYVTTRLRTNTLLGLNSVIWTDGKRDKYNSALLVRGDGTIGERYDKIHLVPFGEYVPFRETFPWLQNFTPYSHDYSCTPGESWTRFELPTAKRTYRFGVLICYEDTDPFLARRYNPAFGSEPGVDFLVNISNDGWFDGTEEHEGHLAVCRFRAIEARRSVVRSVNMGISAVIDPDGRVVALPEESWSKSKKISTVLRAEVPIDYRQSPYAAIGDWVAALCWAGLVGGLILARIRTPHGVPK